MMVDKNTKIIAIIPARGGSKGILRKNLKQIGGIPLVGRTIIQALKAPSIDKVIVSTEDDEIALTSKNYGADVIMRPQSLIGDKISSEEVLLDVLLNLNRQGYVPELILLLQCTSPFMQTMDLENVIKILQGNNADVVFSVFPWHGFLWHKTSNGNVEPINHKVDIRKMRQDLEPTYKENGAIYAMRTSGFIDAKNRFFGKVFPYVMPSERSLDIDEPRDLALAEFFNSKFGEL